MIYIENNLEKQDVFIPRNDGSTCYVSPYDKGYQDGYQDGIEDCGDCPIQQKEVVLTATTETISPDQGYAGMDSVFVDARQLALEKYNEGYHEGEEDGAEEQKSKLETATFDRNGEYTREDGWSAVTVDVPKDIELGTLVDTPPRISDLTYDTYINTFDPQQASVDGWGRVEIGLEFIIGDAKNQQKALMTGTTFTQNGLYRREDGWNEVIVEVPQTGTSCNLESKTETVTADTQTILPSSGYDGMSEVVVDATDYGQEKYDEGHGDGYNEGFSDGQTDILSGMTATAFTQNDTYTNASGWSAVTVNVPQTGSSCNLEASTYTLQSGFTGDTIYPSSGYDGMSAVTITDGGYGREKYDEGYGDGALSPCPLQDKSVVLTATTECIYPDSGNYRYYLGTANAVWNKNNLVDTGVYPTQTSTARLKYVGRGVRSDRIVGSIDGYQGCNDNSDYRVFDLINLTLDVGNARRTIYSISSITQNSVVYDITYGNAYIYDNINETYLLQNGTQTVNTGYTYTVDFGSIWIKEFIIEDGGVELYHGVPREVNGVAGLYDTVSNTFNAAYSGATNTPIVQAVSIDGYQGLSSVCVDASNLCQEKYNEGYQDGLNDCPACPQPSLEAVSYALPSGFTGATITPSSGYDGMSSVAITDGGYGQEKYDEGYQDGLGDCPAPNLEQKSVTLTATTECFTPSSGYDGFSEVCVDASGIYQNGYNDGYNDAFNKGGDYLTFEFFDSGGIMFYYDVYANPSGITGHTPLTVEYSINSGPWSSMTAVQINNFGWNPQITLSQGDIVKVKGLNDSYKQDYENGSIYNHFWVREAYIYGNTMSLIYGDFFMDKTAFKSGSTDVFNELFNVHFECNGIYSHPTRDLVLPATSLVRCCYRKMFAWTSISRAPELPFTGTAWESCEEMFKNCRGITSAPDLLSSGIAYGAYDRMFSGCTNLNYVKCLGTVRSFSSEGTNGWLANVASTGTFVKKANSTIWTSGTSGIPSGWTVQEIQ